MPATLTQDLLQRLRGGRFDPSDLSYLEQVKPDDLLADLAAGFPVCFQQRRAKGKWEIGLARSVEYRLVLRRRRQSFFVFFEVVPVLRRCLMLSGEDDRVTGVSMASRIEVRRSARPPHAVRLTTARGFKLDRFPDGWELKPFLTKKVRLTEDFLRGRGWQFDALQFGFPMSGSTSRP
jgi:hypothetical protein